MTIITSDRLGLPSPDLPEAPVDIPSIWQRRAAILDGLAPIDSGPLSSRPAAGVLQFYIVTDQPDSPRVDADFGTGWTTIGGKPLAPVKRLDLDWEHDYAPHYPHRKTLVSLSIGISLSTWVTHAFYNNMLTVQGLVTMGAGITPVIANQMALGGWWGYYATIGSGTTSFATMSFVVPADATYRAHAEWQQSMGGTSPFFSLDAYEQVV